MFYGNGKAGSKMKMRIGMLLLAGAFALGLMAPDSSATLINNGTIRLGSDQVWGWGVYGSGTFTGDGLLTLGGSLNPGNSPGIMSLGVDTALTSTHSLNIEVAGATTAGEDFDAIHVLDGHFLQLGGTLSLDLFTPGTPLALSAGDTLDIITAESGAAIVGAFDVLNLGGVTPGEGLTWEVVYSANAVILGVQLDPAGAPNSDPIIPVPEPATVALLAMGLAGYSIRRLKHC